MLELNDEMLPVKIGGVVYELKKPTRGQVARMMSQMKTDKQKENSINLIGEFLVECGLPSEIEARLQVGHYEPLMEALVGSKKK